MKRKRVEKTELNPNEKKTLAAFPKNGEPIALAELAKLAFRGMGNKSTTRGNSWTRNSLRFLVRTKRVAQLGRGLYVLTSRIDAVKKAPKKPKTRSTVSHSSEKTKENSEATDSVTA